MENKFEQLKQIVFEKLQQAENRKITESNRCLFAKQTETLSESKARQKGFISGLMVVRNEINRLEKL